MSPLSEAVPGDSGSAGGPGALLPPLLADTESPFDLEQQWQDLMSIMEMQVSSGGRGDGVCPSRRISVWGLCRTLGSWMVVVRGRWFCPSLQMLLGHPRVASAGSGSIVLALLAKAAGQAGLERGSLTQLFLVSSRRWK